MSLAIRPARGDIRQTAIRTAENPPPMQVRTFAAPVNGWVANQNLATPPANGACVLENFFPSSTGIRMRGGSSLYATIEEDLNIEVESLFAYNFGAGKLFAASETKIFDVTTPLDAETEIVPTVTGRTGGEYSTVPLQTVGGSFLYLFNGVDLPLLYDGSNFRTIRDSATYSLPFDAQTSNFTVGQVVTGGTSSATGTILSQVDSGATGTLTIYRVNGDFQDNETITDPLGGSATSNFAGTWASQISEQYYIGSSGYTLDPADIIHGWLYAKRLFMAEKDTLRAWYLPVASISGTALSVDLSGVFIRGGSLMFGAAWSQDSGDGTDDRCAFFTDQGEVAIFAGTDPSDADLWVQIGRYDLSTPMGKNAAVQFGGDVVTCTVDGAIPLSAVVTKDPAQLSLAAVSRTIEPEWKREALRRGDIPWQAVKWAAKNMAIVSLPVINDTTPSGCLVVNLETGAWAKYTGWDVRSLCVFQDQAYFGTTTGQVFLAEAGGLDNGSSYECRLAGLFEPLAEQGQTVQAKLVRATLRAGTAFNAKVSLSSNYNTQFPTAPSGAEADTTASVWDVDTWDGTLIWDAANTDMITISSSWKDAARNGFAHSPQLQIVSGSTVAPNVELVSIDVTFEAGGVVVGSP